VINGQKVWTSGASQANWMFLLARTEPGKPRRAGLSYLLLDMGQPGVEVRPLRQINGSAEFSEVFLTGARTPLDQIVGGRGNGWAVSRTTLAAERTTLAAPETSAALMASLIRLAQRTERDGVPAIQDPVIRARLAELQGWINAQKYASYRQAGARTAGGMIDLALLNKLMHADIAERVARLALEILGPAAILDPAASQRPGDERWLNQFFGSLGIAIAGGTSNIQRNIIAERGLGLPRDPVGAGQ
jgi:alkylation response protein AidB-like acyl-CoA dehydrogenase